MLFEILWFVKKYEGRKRILSGTRRIVVLETAKLYAFHREMQEKIRTRIDKRKWWTIYITLFPPLHNSVNSIDVT